MSTLVDNATALYRTQLAGILGDSIAYTPAGATAETINAQIEPYESSQEEDEDDVWKQIETIVTAIIGTETGDVSAVAIKDTVTFHGYEWGVTRILSQFGVTGVARLAVVRLGRISAGSPGVLLGAPAQASGGRFAKRGGT